ncbi:MAG: hypothetical protein ACQEVA_22865 [Myxococcota bacterium]
MNYLKRSLQLSAIALALLAFNLPEAQADRRHSLAENRLIEDKDDVFAFPQLAVDYANLASFEYGPSYQAGNGMFIFGSEDLAFGVTAHRGDTFNNNALFPYSLASGLALNAPATPLDGFVSGPASDPANPDPIDPAPGTVFDLFMGADLGGGKVGGRLALGHGAAFETLDGADGTTGAARTYFLLQGGYSLVGDLSLDISGRLAVDLASQQAEGDTALSGSGVGFGLSARGYYAMAEDVRLGFLGETQFNTVGQTDFGPDLGDNDDDVTSRGNFFGFQAGLGPEYTVEDNTTIAGYAVLGFANTTNDPDVDETTGGDVVSANQFVLPGLHLAADIQVLEWLYFRSGLQYAWAVHSAASNDEENDEVDTFGQRGARGATESPISAFDSPGGFGWRAGIGFEVDNFSFDGSFQNGFILNGPNFIGGGAGFLAIANAKYNF